MSYYEEIKAGGFDVESEDTYTWGGDPSNEFVPNERVNEFIQSRLLRANRYEDMSADTGIPAPTEQYRKFLRSLYSGFGEINPYAKVSVDDLTNYIIENSGLKDIVWKHLVELFNCIAELNELVRTQALQHCDHISTIGLDLQGEKLDILIRDPVKLEQIINAIIDFINCTNTVGTISTVSTVKPTKYSHVKSFEAFNAGVSKSKKITTPDFEEVIDTPSLDSIIDLRKWVKTLMDEEIKIGKYLRELEAYHSYIVKKSDKLFEKCKQLRADLRGSTVM